MAYKNKNDRLSEVLTKFREAYDILDEIACEAEENVSNMEGTNLENTERFQRLQEASEQVSSARDTIDEALSDLETVEF